MNKREAKRRVLSCWGQMMQQELPGYLMDAPDVDPESGDWDRLWDAQQELGDELIKRSRRKK